MHVLGLFFVLLCLPSALLDFAMPVWKSEPKTQIEDAYKWIFQATRGGEHAVPSKEMAEKYLDEEWKNLSDAPAGEPLRQPLCGDNSIVRLNLRPFRAGGGSENDLAEAFVKSSQEFTGDTADFLVAWNELGKRLKKKSRANLTYKNWENLDAEMKKQNYPAIHHSKIYEESKHPAYRILTKAEADKITANLK